MARPADRKWYDPYLTARRSVRLALPDNPWEYAPLVAIAVLLIWSRSAGAASEERAWVEAAALVFAVLWGLYGVSMAVGILAGRKRYISTRDIVSARRAVLFSASAIYAGSLVVLALLHFAAGLWLHAPFYITPAVIVGVGLAYAYRSSEQHRAERADASRPGARSAIQYAFGAAAICLISLVAWGSQSLYRFTPTARLVDSVPVLDHRYAYPAIDELGRRPLHPRHLDRLSKRVQYLSVEQRERSTVYRIHEERSSRP
ncbi:MAG: stage II sporulation protein M [Phycisphaerales bacterium]|nr:stage II sporulation protein M [Phycisphaerales bacterium]